MDLQPGDHIYVRRYSRFYSHHGIYMGNNRVVHYTGNGGKEKKSPRVKETVLEEFLKGGTLRRYKHKKRLPQDETLKLAREYLTDGDYSLIFNNCEHFATYCATGKKKSRQVRFAIKSSSVVMLGTISAFIIQNRKQKKDKGLP
ncbi:MAG: lecithin retinol acyltransferase family protein [Thermodesulfobacteriota bacterium]|nr:lecithin retinol acyltransferase family protein [Thermodesulfobacteriota bacterium]